MLARPRPLGFSPFICLRRAAEEYPSRRISRGKKPLRDSVCAKSEFHSVSFKIVCIRNELCNRKARTCLSTAQRSSFSTKSRQYAQQTVAAEESQLDVCSAPLPDDLEKLTVVALKEILAHRLLKTTGRKSELIARLREVDKSIAHVVDKTDQKTSKKVTNEGDSEVPDSLGLMTVKELKERLRELGLPLTGLKDRLIERLAAHEREKQLSDIEPMEMDRASAREEKQASLSGDNASSESFNYLPRFMSKDDEVWTNDLPKNDSSLQSPSGNDIPLATSIQNLAEHELPSAFVSADLDEYPQSSMAKPEPQSSNDSSIRQLQQGLSVSEVHSRVLLAQLAISSLRSAVSSLPTTSTVEIIFDDAENSLNRDFAINCLQQGLVVAEAHSRVLASKFAISHLRSSLRLLPTSKFAPIVKTIDHSTISSASRYPEQHPDRSQRALILALEKRLSKAKEEIPELRLRAEDLLRKVKGLSFLGPNSVQGPHYHGMTEEAWNNYQRSMSMGMMFFSKACDEGIEFGSATATKPSLRLAELPRESISALQDHFLRHLDPLARTGKRLWEANYLNAWRMALNDFAKEAGAPRIYAPMNISVQEPGRKSERAASKEPEAEAGRSTEGPTIKPTIEHADTDSQPGSIVQPRFVPEDLTKPIATSYTNDLPAKSPSAAIKRRPEIHVSGGISTRKAPASMDHIIQSRSGRPLWNQDFLNYPTWRARFLEHLSGTPVTIELTVDDHQKKRFLKRDPSDYLPGPFLTTGDPYCQIFNSMWLRLGLIDHIKSIRPGNTDLDYSVTFKSFEAAAAFVNRPNEHWLDDPITGQIYATWQPEERPPQTEVVPMAIVILPRATIDVWRRIALEHNVEVSKYGLPYVDWGRSFQSVLMRMKMDFGRHCECRWYKVVSEYVHRIVIVVCFRDHESLERFMSRKEDHCLSSIWKDRFFVKERGVKYRPEWMPEPTNDNPVPKLEETSNTTLKKLVRDNKVYNALGRRELGELKVDRTVIPG